VRARRSSDTDLPLVMRQLQWGSSWIEAYYRRRQWIARDSLGDVLDVVAVALEPRSFDAAATSTVTELAQLMACERVSVGFRKRTRTKVAALSHSAEFSDKNNLIRAIGAAIDAAVDQQCVLQYPNVDPDTPHVLRAHAELAEQYAAGHVCTVPLASGDEVVGGLVFERAKPFARHDVEQLEYVGALVGPILEAKRLEDRWIGSKILASVATFRDRLFGPRHPALKLSAVTAALLLALLTLVHGTYRVAADASLEGVVQQSVTAPISGYVSASNYRAGDVVEKGAVLAALDERDFQLQRLSLINEREMHRREYSRSLAEGDRAMVRVLDAQIEQADAEIRLLDEQLARTRITAPFTGLVVDGDLSQSLSAPVERGQVLFKLAPLDRYRVILMVDERDIAALAEGQAGRVALAGAPGDPLAIKLIKITPVSKVSEGQNRFRVEAELDGPPDALRPGMEGVAKVDVGERSLLWIYTHKFTHWLRQWWWRVLP
jgi:multidrug resistance efflux pump